MPTGLPERAYRSCRACLPGVKSTGPYRGGNPTKEFQMPVILWLLGVPITVIILLMLIF